MLKILFWFISILFSLPSICLSEGLEMPDMTLTTGVLYDAGACLLCVVVAAVIIMQVIDIFRGSDYGN